MTAKELFDDWWQNLESKKQTKYKKIATMGVCLAIGLIAYYASGRSEAKKVEKPKEETVSPLSESILEEDIRGSVTSLVAGEVDKQMQKHSEAQLAAMRDMMEEMNRVNQAGQPESLDVGFPESPLADAGSPEPPPAPPEPSTDLFPPAPAYPGNSGGQSVDPHAGQAPQIIGGIGRVQGTPAISQKEDKAAKKRKIRLPVSFMKAKVLIGIDAMTSQVGEGNPEPILVRVQAPAQLPNSIKAQLTGCFAVVNAWGNLAKERIQTRAVSLTCMSEDGRALIDTPIKGFLADGDGKKDLSGIVISKAGSNLARSVAAGFVSGFGNTATLSSTETATSPLGTTQVIDPDKAIRAGAGEGIKSGSDELQKYFLDLAKQAVPVIENGAGKDVVLVLQETVEFEIEDVSYDS